MARFQNSLSLDRRVFIAGASATLVSGTPGFASSYRPSVEPVVRKNLQKNDADTDLAIYRTGVAKMLALPPEDPRNWYRNAFTHTFDCPHGNWWFLVWHRGYLVHLEAIIRELTGDVAFALPYWDWTVEDKVPAPFFQDGLDPSAATFGPYDDFSAFSADFEPVMRDVWDNFSPEQAALQQRRFGSFQTLWQGVERALFFPRADARTNVSKSAPQLSPSATAAVKEQNILNLLAPTTFETLGPTHIRFESAVTADHYARAQQAVLESQPHNTVHGALGGFMGNLLSPADPIFFLHHANVDRLWDVWTRKQIAANGPTGPDPSRMTAWQDEPFLFFHDASGAPAALQRAGDYVDVAAFGYGYEDGTGESVVGERIAVAAADVPSVAASAGASNARQLRVAVPEALSRASGAPPAFVSVTIAPEHAASGSAFNVFVGAEGRELNLATDGPNFAGSFALFGHAAPGEPLSFAVGASEVIDRLRAAGSLADGEQLNVAVVAAPTPRRGTQRNAETAPAVASEPSPILSAATVGAF